MFAKEDEDTCHVIYLQDSVRTKSFCVDKAISKCFLRYNPQLPLPPFVQTT